MKILSNYSEYLGTRIAMHDALQRYYAQNPGPLGNAGKVQMLQECVQDACNDNRLLGDRKEIVGKAWAEFLGSRDPASVAAFAADADVIAYARQAPQIHELAPTLTIVKSLGLLTKARNFAFEQVAQRNGLIDYVAGETLSKHLQAAEQRLRDRGADAPPRLPETPENAAAIKQSFDTPLGNVDPKDMGLPPKSHTDGLDAPSEKRTR